MRLYIVRGLPGAGKSTYGRGLAEEKHALFIEPDMGCYRHGEYDYDPCDYQDSVSHALELVSLAGKFGWHVVFADVLPTKLHIDRVRLAYTVRNNLPLGLCPEVFTLRISVETSIRRNIHAVNPDDISEMCDAWEDWEGETIIDTETEEGK